MFFYSKYSCTNTLKSSDDLLLSLTSTPIELNSFEYNSIQVIDECTIMLSPKSSNFIYSNSFMPKIRIEFCKDKINFTFFLSTIKRMFILLIFALNEIGFVFGFMRGALPDDAKFLIVFPIILFVLFNIIYYLIVKKLQKTITRRFETN